MVSDIGEALKALPASSAGFWSGGLNALLNNLAQVLLVAAVAIVVFLLVIGGIRWATAGGDKEVIGKTQKAITGAIIGLIIVFAAWAILNTIRLFFGLGGITGTPGGGGSSAYVCPGLGSLRCKSGTLSPGPCNLSDGRNCCICRSSGLWEGTTVSAGQCVVKPGDCQ